jgi:quercetin dioxygenase-like cupin family protein
MQRETFLAELAASGFGEALTVQREPDGFVDLHSHPFEARALILSGLLSLQVDGVERVYPQGSVFHLPAGQPHVERYGPAGVTYLVGRK